MPALDPVRYSFRRLHTSIAVVLVVGAVACQPQIGDSCVNSADCSVRQERTCDTTWPGGYCTVFGCSPGSCPDEAECIGFQALVSSAPECAQPQSSPRLQRAACLYRCGSDSDCRTGYVCVDLNETNPWAARILETDPRGKVCMLAPPPEPVGGTEVCEPRVRLEPVEIDAGLAPAEPDAGQQASE